MSIIRIDDPADPRVSEFRDLTDVALRSVREPAEGLYIAESATVIARAIAAGHTARSVLTQQKWLDQISSIVTEAPIYLVSDEVAESITGYSVHRGALAAMRRPALLSVPELLDTIAASAGARRRVAVLEDLVDHANVGSAFRNAAALGVDAVIVTPACADPLYRRAVKTSMGNVFNVPWTRGPVMPALLPQLTEGGFTTVAFTLTGETVTLDEFVARDVPALAMVFGTEGRGVDPRTARAVDARVTIPMEPGVDSLNVAAATAVAFYATR